MNFSGWAIGVLCLENKLLMKLSFKYHLIFSVAGISLLTGYLNYLLFQPDIILFNIMGVHVNAYGIKNNFILHFFTGYFSDIAWCFALCCIVFALAELKYISYSGKILLLLLPFITETLQYSGVIKGTFDWFDIIIYTIIITVFILFFPPLKFFYEKD